MFKECQCEEGWYERDGKCVRANECVNAGNLKPCRKFVLSLSVEVQSVVNDSFQRNHPNMTVSSGTAAQLWNKTKFCLKFMKS